MDRWSGKIALVTGASAGIGAAITVELAKAGVKVFGLARRIQRVEELKQNIGKVKGEIIPLKGDVSKEDEILSAFKVIKEKFGTIHILVNNAGIGRCGTLSDSRVDLMKETFEVNVMGLLICTQQALKLMKESEIDDGHIININSVLGHSIPGSSFTLYNVYPASKHAVTGLTDSLRFELNSLKTKIKVTSISPGIVKTEIVEATVIGSGIVVSEDEIKNFAKDMPKLEAEDVANAVIYVLSTPPHVNINELTIRPVGEEF